MNWLHCTPGRLELLQLTVLQELDHCVSAARRKGMQANEINWQLHFLLTKERGILCDEWVHMLLSMAPAAIQGLFSTST